jgi:hypothetical protein
MTEPGNPPLAHSYMPLPASVISWCQLTSHLAQMPVQGQQLHVVETRIAQDMGGLLSQPPSPFLPE